MRQSPTNKPAGENSGGRSLLSPCAGGKEQEAELLIPSQLHHRQEPDRHPAVWESSRPCGTAAHGAGPVPDAKAASHPHTRDSGI